MKVCILFVVIIFNGHVVNSIEDELTGVLINGQYGTQLFDPIDAPHETGQLNIGLPTATGALGSAAVLGNDDRAYFANTGMIS
jgi:hypothetical protein